MKQNCREKCHHADQLTRDVDEHPDDGAGAGPAGRRGRNGTTMQGYAGGGARTESWNTQRQVCCATRLRAVCDTAWLERWAERLYIDNAVVLVNAECTLPPEIITKDGNLDIAVDGTGQVTLTRRTRSTIDLWDLHERVNAAATTTDVDSKISTQTVAINTKFAASLTQNVVGCANQATSAIASCTEKTTAAVSQARTYTDSKVMGIDAIVTETLSTLTAAVLSTVRTEAS